MSLIRPAPAIVLREALSAILAERGFDLRNGRFDVSELHRAVIYGSVMGSFCCEEFGVERFRTLARKEIDQRFEEFRRFTAF